MPARCLSTVLWSSILVLLFCSTAAAQSLRHALTVRVADPTGAPVLGARVIVSPRDTRLPLTLETSSMGEARFEALLEGVYVLEVDAPGFAHVARTIRVASERTRVAVSLPLGGVTEHVVVTGADRLQTAAEVSKAVTSVDSADVEARHEFSVADALRTVPGATVQRLGGPGAFTSIKMRGLREQDTSILVDGVRFRDAASPQGDATAFAGELYVTNLDRIEVLRGSGSSLYGSHAIGGAVNLITRTGSGRPAGDAVAEAGGLGFSRATAHFGGGGFVNRVSYSVGAGHTRVTRGVDGADEARSTSIQARGDVRVAASARASVRVFASDASSAINELPAAIGPLPSTGFVRATPATFTSSVNDPDSVRDSTFLSTLVRFEQRPSSAFGYTVSLHRLTTDRLFSDGPRGVSAFEPIAQTQSRFRGSIDTLAVRTDHEWNTRHGTTLGYEFERERYQSDSAPVNPLFAWRADIRQDSHTVSIQHEVRLDAFQATASVRGQRFALNDVTLTPADRAPFSAGSFTTPPASVTADLAAAQSISGTGTKFRAHAGNAYRAPAMFERAGTSFGSRGYSVFGDPRLAPERSVSVDAGIDQAFAGSHAQVSVTWFHTRLTRVLTFQSLDRLSDPFGRASGYRSADGRTARGIEVGTQLQPVPALRLGVAYTFVDAPPPGGTLDGLPRAAAISAHQFSAHVLQRIARLQLSFELEAAGDHYVSLFDSVSFGSRAYRFDGLVKADLAATYSLSRGRAGARLFGTVENLFDHTYFVQGFRTPGRIGRGGVQVTF
jgi:iron complex outermembrane receptor protein